MAQTIWIVDECDYEGCMNCGIFATYEEANQYFSDKMEETVQSDDEQYEYHVNWKKEYAAEKGVEPKIPSKTEYLHHKFTIFPNGGKEFRSFVYTLRLYSVELGWHEELLKDIKREDIERINNGE